MKWGVSRCRINLEMNGQTKIHPKLSAHCLAINPHLCIYCLAQQKYVLHDQIQPAGAFHLQLPEAINACLHLLHLVYRRPVDLPV